MILELVEIQPIITLWVKTLKWATSTQKSHLMRLITTTLEDTSLKMLAQLTEHGFVSPQKAKSAPDIKSQSVTSSKLAQLSSLPNKSPEFQTAATCPSSTLLVSSYNPRPRHPERPRHVFRPNLSTWRKWKSRPQQPLQNLFLQKSQHRPDPLRPLEFLQRLRDEVRHRVPCLQDPHIWQD